MAGIDDLRDALERGSISVNAKSGAIYFPGDVSTLTYSASITPDAGAGMVWKIVATDTSAFTINAPSNPDVGAVRTFDIKNSSGGTQGTITWNAVFLLAGAAFTNAGNGKRRTITFYYDGTNWVELNRASGDL
jgi:hypothetical protein